MHVAIGAVVAHEGLRIWLLVDVEPGPLAAMARTMPTEHCSDPHQFRAAYLELGYPNSTKAKSWLLSIPATYVLDSSGFVVISYLDADHTTRLEPTEIIAALTHLRAANIPDRNNR